MATLPGLGAAQDEPIVIDMAEEGAPVPEFDQAGNVLSIEYPDGSLEISLDGNPLERASKDKLAWFDNLVDHIDGDELGRIASDILRGVDDDIESRREWIEARATGIRLLGLKIETPGVMGGADGAPVEGMSKVRHPLLLEAVLRFQANARSELLPTDGPVKIRNDDNNATYQEDETANALERDLNHYLTSTATEYYPDTDRMLLLTGFGGTGFKKVYYCPLRSRPVSESVDADDLIVNNAATDLANAKRVTHRIMMRPSTVKRMQILGAYRDIDLGTPNERKPDSLQREKNDQEGVSETVSNPADRDREIYECYCELDIKGFEHRHKGKVSGLEIPYRVTIDVTSREVLSVVRDYDEATKDLPVAKSTFVKYPFVPGFGFYDIGLLHILGNTTNALTAAWREMLDNGMYANFPGFLMADTGGRQNTNIFRIPPGGGAMVKTNGMSISQAVMPLPYNTGGMAPLMALTSDMAQTGARVGGTSELQVGEGRPDAPVGTTLALIDQATKILNSVHKRLHAAQAEEFRLLCKCFEEHPEAFWQRNYQSTMKWDEETFLNALKNYDLTPQADPNTASHSQRVMKVMGLKQMQAANPDLYDPKIVDTVALQTMGWSNPNQFFKSPDQAAQPKPEILAGIAKAESEKTSSDAAMLSAQAKMAEVQAKVQAGAFAPKQESAGGGGGLDPNAGEAQLIAAHARMMDAETKRAQLGVSLHENAINDQNRDLDREADERIEHMKLAKEILSIHSDQEIARHAAEQAMEREKLKPRPSKKPKGE